VLVAGTAAPRLARAPRGTRREEEDGVSPSKRERDYARRRHQDWQQRQSARTAQARERRRTALSAVGIFVAVAAVIVAAYLIGRDPSSTPAASPSAASQTPSASPSNPCPAPPSSPSPSPSQLAGAPDPSLAQGRTWTATIATSCGDIAVELDGAKAPAAVASFVTLAQKGFFAATPCHRLTTSGIYVLQCGDPTGTGTGGPGYTFGPVENAPSDDVYPAGTLAMARQSGNGSSMGSQFFLVYADSTIPHDAAGGYTVFGRITSGLDVLTRVASAGTSGGTGDGAPNTPISIEQVTVQ
jgi:peptidyl-prolyl cis-trans isomerase B (cyclophilin B)